MKEIKPKTTTPKLKDANYYKNQFKLKDYYAKV